MVSITQVLGGVPAQVSEPDAADDVGDRMSCLPSGGSAPASYPPLNLREDESNLYVEAEFPGFNLDDLEMYVTGGNQLSIKGERKQPELEQGTWHRQERGYGSFSRLMELPGPVDGDRVSAEFRHGVLTITLPKKEEAKPRRIEVKVLQPGFGRPKRPAPCEQSESIKEEANHVH